MPELHNPNASPSPNITDLNVKSKAGKIYTYRFRQYSIRLDPTDARYFEDLIDKCSKAKGKRVSIAKALLTMAKHFDSTGGVEANFS